MYYNQYYKRKILWPMSSLIKYFGSGTGIFLHTKVNITRVKILCPMKIQAEYFGYSTYIGSGQYWNQPEYSESNFEIFAS